MFSGLEDIPFAAIDQTGTLEQEAYQAIKLAKLGTAAVIALQAIAAFSALGLVALSWKTYSDGRHRKSRRTSRKSSRRYARLRTTTLGTRLNRGWRRRAKR